MPRLVLVAVALAITASLCACGSTDSTASPDAPTTTPTAPETTPPTAPSPEAAVLAAEDGYRNFSRIWTQANDPPDSHYALLDEVATGSALTLVRAAIDKHAAEHLRYRDPPNSQRSHAFRNATLVGESIVFDDCEVDDGIVLDARDGHMIDDSVATYLWNVTMQLKEGRWKVADNTQLGKWPGAVACDAAL